MNVSTTAYTFAHGHAPRGRGNYAFFFLFHDDRNCVGTPTGLPWRAPAALHYGTARAAAIAEARSRGASAVALATST